MSEATNILQFTNNPSKLASLNLKKENIESQFLFYLDKLSEINKEIKHLTQNYDDKRLQSIEKYDYYLVSQERFKQVATKYQINKIDWLKKQGLNEVSKRARISKELVKFREFSICEHYSKYSCAHRDVNRKTIFYVRMRIHNAETGEILDERMISVGKQGGMILISSKTPKPQGENVLAGYQSSSKSRELKIYYGLSCR